MTSKQITDLIQTIELTPGNEGETQTILEICEALNARIDEVEHLALRAYEDLGGALARKILEADQLRRENQQLAEPHTPTPAKTREDMETVVALENLRANVRYVASECARLAGSYDSTDVASVRPVRQLSHIEAMLRESVK